MIAPVAKIRHSSLSCFSLAALPTVVLMFATLVTPIASAEDDDWVPPEPTKSGWDWARLDTGEWIKGEMMVMHEDVMLFDSDNFDEISIDWEDVHALRLARPRIFRRKGRRTYAGMGEIRDGVIRILTPDDERVEFPKDELVSIVYTSESELRNWRVRIGANLAARAGNTDQQDLSATALIRRNTAFNRWTSRYTGTFSKVDGDRTINNHRASTELDFLVTSRFFVRVPSFEFFSDEFQNIDGRYTPGASLGYDVIDTSIVDWLLTIGGAGQITEYDGGETDVDGATLFTSELAIELPRDVDIDLNYSLQLIFTDLDKTNHNTSLVISIEIWGPLEVDIGAYWDRIEGPQRDDDGDRPKSDDFRLTAGISLEF
jgi:hypothetical protein